MTVNRNKFTADEKFLLSWVVFYVFVEMPFNFIISYGLVGGGDCLKAGAEYFSKYLWSMSVKCLVPLDQNPYSNCVCVFKSV